MTSPVKWIFFSLLFMMIVLGIAYASSVQNIATRTTGEIDVLSDIEKIGVIRKGLNENGEASEQLEYVDVEELIARFFSDVVDVQKKLNYDIQLDFVFLDEAGNMTKNENEVRSIQYRLQYLNDKGEVKGTAEGRQELHQLGSAIAGGSGKAEVKSAYFTSTESPSAEQTETFEINGLKNILSISSNTGTVEVVKVEGNKVTVKMKNGEASRTVQTGGEYVPEDMKEAEVIRDYYEISYSYRCKDYEEGRKEYCEWKPDDCQNFDNSTTIVDSKKRGLFDEQSKTYWELPYSGGSIFRENIIYSDEEGYKGTLPLVKNGNLYYFPHEEPILVYDYDFTLPCVPGSTTNKKELVGDLIYRGIVTRPEIDTRTYENYYYYDLVIEYE